MFCTHCGQPLSDSVKFCTSCGTKTPSGETAAASEVQPQPQPQQPLYQEAPSEHSGEQGAFAYTAVPAPSQPHPAAVILKKYWEFILDNFKAPARRSEKVNETEKINGFIQLGVMSILFAFAYFIIEGNLFYLNAGIDLSDFEEYLYGDTNRFTEHFFKPFIYFVIVAAVMIGLIFLVSKWMKATHSILDTAARFGSFLVIPSAIFLLVAIFKVISNDITSYLVVLGFLSIAASVGFTIYSMRTEDSKGIDPFYGTLLIYFVVIVILFGVL
ncbi:zinc ribbon domain-containing protein [Marinicrinis lubricantis]|uniref:Zinc ribbon domain-containing protein n=1 Tax=Marinicrinis lubricantis TaxID=2086470 RepID=A0ABW1IVD6_9BACL